MLPLSVQIFVFATSMLIVLASVPLVRNFALRWRIGDKPNGRKFHASSIPHLGGIGIACGILGSLVLTGFLFGDSWKLLAMILPGMSVIIGLGLLDDILSLKALQKLAVQIIGAGILVYSGFHLYLGIPALDGVSVLTIPLTIFFIVGILNSINLVDGHDGLAAGLCFISSVAFVVLSMAIGSNIGLIFSLAITAACLSFLTFNFPPGKIFMGDTGSMLLGTSLGLVACTLSVAKPSLYTLAAACFVLAVPMLDTWLAIARRLALHVPIFKADYLHIHHLLSSFGFSERQTLFVLYSIQGLLAVIGVFAYRGSLPSIILGAAILLALYSMFLKWMISPQMVVEATPAAEAENEIHSIRVEVAKEKAAAKLAQEKIHALDKVAK